MSQGSNLVINPLERGVSDDINNLQSVARSRRLADAAAANRGMAVAPDWAGKGGVTVAYDIAGLAASSVRNGVLNGLTVALTNTFSVDLTIQPGAVCYFDPAAGPDADYDPNSYQIGRLQTPLSGVLPGGVWGGTAPPPAATAEWVLVARPVHSTVVTAPREVFDPGTGQFVTQTLPKLQDGEVEFLFLDYDGSALPYPGDEYQLIAHLRAVNGVFTNTSILDLRQLLQADSREGFPEIDDDTVHYTLSGADIHSLSWRQSGRRMYFSSAALDATTYLEDTAPAIGANAAFAMITFECARPDGSFFRPPLIEAGGQAGANLSLSALNGTGQKSNGMSLPLPSAAYAAWENWILNWGTSLAIPLGMARTLGTFVTRVNDAEAQRVIRSGRTLTNTDADHYMQMRTGIAISANNRFSTNKIYTVNANGYIADVAGLTLPTFLTDATFGKAATAIKWRLTGNCEGCSWDDSAIGALATLWIKMASPQPNAANTVAVFPLGPATSPATLFSGDFCFEFWWPASTLTTMYLDIRNLYLNGRLYDPTSDNTGTVRASFDAVEFRF